MAVINGFTLHVLPDGRLEITIHDCPVFLPLIYIHFVMLSYVKVKGILSDFIWLYFNST